MNHGQQLEDVYRQAVYLVASQPQLQLRVDHYCPQLDSLLNAHSCSKAAFISAANPGSVLQPKVKNQSRHEHLLQRVTALALPYIEGKGCDPTGSWPDEPSLLVMGISKQQALQLGQDFQQNALLWCQLNQPVLLQWLK